MNHKPNEKLSNELIDSSLDEDNRLSLEKVQKLAKDNLFYIIAGTTLIAGVVDYLHIYHREFDPVPYMNKHGFFLPPVPEFLIGSFLLSILWFRDKRNKIKSGILSAYMIALLCALDQGIDNQKLFNKGFEDGENIQILDQELIDNLYYGEGVNARQRGFRRRE